MLTAAGEAPADSQALSGILLCGTNVSARVVAQGTWFRPERYRHRRASGREIWRRSAWQTRPPGRQTAQCRRPTRPATGRTCATSCWSATPEPARPRWSRRCCVATGTIHRAGRVEDGTTVSDYDEAELRQQRSVNLALRPVDCTAASRSTCSTPRATPTSSVTCAPACGPPTARCSSSRPPSASTASTRMLWEECAAVGMPRAVVLTKLDHARAPTMRRRSRPARRRSATTSCRCTCRCVDDRRRDHRPDRAALAAGCSTTPGGTRQESDATPRRARTADRGGAQRAHRGHHRGVRGRDPDGPLPRRRGHRPRRCSSTTSRQAVARGSFYPVIPVCAADRAGDRRAARGHDQRVPVAARAPDARRSPVPTASPRSRSAATRPARWSPRSSRPPPTLRRPDLSRPGLLRHPAARPDGARLRALPGRPRPRGPRRRRARRRAHLAARQDPAAGAVLHRRRHLRGRQADTRRDRRHAVRQGRPAADGAVGDARAAAAGRDRRPRQGRRGQALAKGLARLAAEDPTLRLESNAETHQLVLWCMGEAHADVLLDRLRTRYGVDRRPGRPCGCRCGRPSPARPRPRPPRQAVRRPRPVRRLRHRGRAAADGRRLRVRRQGRRRRGAAAVHPVGREGRSGPDGARHRARGLPGGRHPGHPGRRQGAQRRLLRHGLPDRRRRWPCARRPPQPASTCSSRSTRSASWCPTTTSARS